MFNNIKEHRLIAGWELITHELYERFKSHNKKSVLQKTLYNFAIQFFQKEDFIRQYTSVFLSMEDSNSGFVSKSSFKNICFEKGFDGINEIEQVFDSIEAENSLGISYTQFLSIAFDKNIFNENQELLKFLKVSFGCYESIFELQNFCAF